MSVVSSFLGDAQNRPTLTWLGSGPVILADGAWTVFKFIVGPESGRARVAT